MVGKLVLEASSSQSLSEILVVFTVIIKGIFSGLENRREERIDIIIFVLLL